MSDNDVLEIELHNAQLNILENRKRFNVIRGGRRFGKSFFLFCLAFEKMNEGNKRVLYTCPTFRDTKERYLEAVALFSQLQGAKWKQGEITYNGSVLLFYGLHKYENIRGNKFHRFLGDEWAIGKYQKEAWEQVIRPTLIDYKGDAYFVSTPKKDSHFELIDKRELKEWKSFHFTSYDNNFIDPEEIDLLKDELPELVIAQEIYAEYVVLEGAKFKQADVRYDSFNCDMVCMGVDLAIKQKEDNDFVAITVIGINEDGSILVKYAGQQKLSFRNQIEWIKSVANEFNPDIIGVEDVGYQESLIQELTAQSNFFIRGITPKKDKVLRSQFLQVKYERGLVYHEPHLRGSEFETQLFAFPYAEHDDMVDSLVYAALSKDLLGTGNAY
jgi:predicted phage terminase large subunit-like protein